MLDPADPLVGQTLGGRYRLERVLGRGGVGTVYEAVQLDLGRKVAVKVLHVALASDPAWARRMEREARATAGLDHPHIVQVTDFQLTPGGLPFLVMERLVGVTLRRIIEREAPLSPSRVVAISAQMLSALGAAHRAGVVHRDIKPENVFVMSTPAAADFVKVLDFGIARGLDGPLGGVTATGAVLGTAGYMAPEQARGEAIDGRADLYAVGACMYEALVGRAAFGDVSTSGASGVGPAGSPIGMIVPISERRPDLDPRLSAVVARALERDPARRFASADEMAEALSLLGAEARGVSITPARVSSAAEVAPTAPAYAPIRLEPLAPRPTPPPPAPPARPGLLPWLVGGGLVAAVALGACVVVGGAIVLVALRPSDEPPPPAPPALAPSADPPPADDEPDEVPPSPGATSSRPRSRPRDAGGGSRRPADAAPPAPPPTPPPPPPTPTKAPDKNPPPLVAFGAELDTKNLDGKKPELQGAFESYVRSRVVPVTRHCFSTTGFQFQNGTEQATSMQIQIHVDGRVEAYNVGSGATNQAICVAEELVARSAPGVCGRTDATMCTFWVRVWGKYR